MRVDSAARQFHRRDVDIGVEVVVAAECAEQVALVHGPSLKARMKNISGGGAYLVVPSFLPRACVVSLDIPSGHGLPTGRISARVMKAAMLDREPSYGVGLHFEDEQSAVVRAIRAHLSDGGAE